MHSHFPSPVGVSASRRHATAASRRGSNLLSLTFLCSLLLLTSCRKLEPLPELFPVPEATLVADSGAPFQLASINGNLAIYDFIFTRCAATCPIMTQRMKEITRRVPRSDIRFISITVDPEHDTPEVLKAYAEKTGRDARWVWLTGKRDEIVDLSVKGFKLAAGEPIEGAEAFLHTSRFVLADRKGTIRGYYDAMSPEAMTQLVRDIGRVGEER